MKLLDRISTLIKADAHGVVESLEDRALLLKQYVREAQAEIERKQAGLEALRAEAQRLGRHKVRLTEKMSAFDEDITLALGKEQEELARFAIKKLLPLRKTAKEIDARLAEIGKDEKDLGDQLTLQRDELEDLKARVREHLAQMPKDDLDDVLGVGPVADEEIELELLHRRQSMEQGAA